MQLLRKYIEKLNISITQVDSNNSLEFSVNQLLDNYFIVPNQVSIEHPVLRCNLEHKETIDCLVQYLIDNKLFNNLLTYGYSVNNPENVSYTPHSVSVNIHVTRLKDVSWELLHLKVGTTNFVELLLNYTVLEYKDGYFQQVVGNMNNIPHRPPKWYTKQNTFIDSSTGNITNKTFIHKVFKNYCLSGPNKISSEIEVLEDILSSGQQDIRHKSKKLPWHGCISALKRKCRTNLNFDHLLDKICGLQTPDKVSNHLERQMPVSDVNRFIILVLEKLLPQKMYGSRKNKSLFFSHVSEMLRLPINGKMFIEDILRKIELKRCVWLGYPYISNSREQFLGSSELLEKFLNWYFKILVPNIVMYFFYCTEVSSGIEVIYFRRSTWKSMIKPFKDNYFSKYLVENLICRNHASYTLSEFNHSRLRIIPKKASGQFRMICVPNKGVDEIENKIYYANKRDVISPVQSILNHLRLKRDTPFVKIFSTMQIAGALEIFKTRLIKRYGTLPVLHFMKFDIESCYDSIPRRKLLYVLKQLLKKEEDGFFVRSKGRLNPHSGVFSTYDVVNGIDYRGPHSVALDKGWAKYLSPHDVTTVVEDEIFKTVVWIKNKCYLRKDGLFQGSSLSGLLVDILYDDMLLHYSEFHCIKKEETLILRLADDFLIISNCGRQIESIKQLAFNGFEEYNAKVNVDKIIIENSQLSPNKKIQFCALDISIQNLEIWKPSDALNISRISSLSSKVLFNQLEWFFNLRLQHNTINTNLNSFDVIASQVGYITTNISTVMINAFRNRNLNFKSFIKYVNRIFSLVIEQCSNTGENLGIEFEVSIREEILHKFLLSFSKHPSRYRIIVQYLKDEVEKYRYIRSLCI
ncbi:similar to Saccharomyces cerevisiae YLR318W EST2 Reverse transcriptase subunit of the telomerase holoenzyme [Maudiozyma saulgeensis]|uniref:Telomerase reverse transcriptase n=1 Tax=Maudiozyma saulgeensis TaxID=1789683 RepID=A0A1X7RAJ7_9SACH|nr:similar to Saccharomyces cerevisiae YLR318W EST2 Reverse transcriptase subunit of the telomerase holoenzyme [Kazachstania saulgeensis]